MFRRTAHALLLFQISRTLALQRYELVKSYTSANFFDEFNFYSDPDPTQGFVQYVPYGTAASTGLISNASGTVYLGVDHSNIYPPTEVGRPSVRLESKQLFTEGLFVLDLNHMPYGCGVWSAFWTSDHLTSPEGGEIDIIEGVNDERRNRVILHTSGDCNVNAALNQTASWLNTDCNAANNSNHGCASLMTEPNNYGRDFNRKGGGVYAMEWTNTTISVWFFPAGRVPLSLTSNYSAPDPTQFGIPSATYSGPCSSNYTNKFYNHSITINTDFCGAWAGEVYGLHGSACPVIRGNTTRTPMDSCKAFVGYNPQNFTDAYWDINSLRVWKKREVVEVGTSSSVVSSSTVSVSSAISDSTVSVPASTPDVVASPTPGWCIPYDESGIPPNGMSTTVEDPDPRPPCPADSSTPAAVSPSSTPVSTPDPSPIVPSSTVPVVYPPAETDPTVCYNPPCYDPLPPEPVTEPQPGDPDIIFVYPIYVDPPFPAQPPGNSYSAIIVTPDGLSLLISILIALETDDVDEAINQVFGLLDEAINQDFGLLDEDTKNILYHAVADFIIDALSSDEPYGSAPASLRKRQATTEPGTVPLLDTSTSNFIDSTVTPSISWEQVFASLTTTEAERLRRFLRLYQSYGGKSPDPTQMDSYITYASSWDSELGGFDEKTQGAIRDLLAAGTPLPEDIDAAAVGSASSGSAPRPTPATLGEGFQPFGPAADPAAAAPIDPGLAKTAAYLTLNQLIQLWGSLDQITKMTILASLPPETEALVRRRLLPLEVEDEATPADSAAEAAPVAGEFNANDEVAEATLPVIELDAIRVEDVPEGLADLALDHPAWERSGRGRGKGKRGVVLDRGKVDGVEA